MTLFEALAILTVLSMTTYFAFTEFFIRQSFLHGTAYAIAGYGTAILMILLGLGVFS